MVTSQFWLGLAVGFLVGASAGALIMAFFGGGSAYDKGLEDGRRRPGNEGERW